MFEHSQYERVKCCELAVIDGTCGGRCPQCQEAGKKIFYIMSCEIHGSDFIE